MDCTRENAGQRHKSACRDSSKYTDPPSRELQLSDTVAWIIFCFQMKVLYIYFSGRPNNPQQQQQQQSKADTRRKLEAMNTQMLLEPPSASHCVIPRNEKQEGKVSRPKLGAHASLVPLCSIVCSQVAQSELDDFAGLLAAEAFAPSATRGVLL